MDLETVVWESVSIMGRVLGWVVKWDWWWTRVVMDSWMWVRDSVIWGRGGDVLVPKLSLLLVVVASLVSVVAMLDICARGGTVSVSLKDRM